MELTLAGKTAIVTGASSGIGLAVTLAYLDAGANVVAVDRAAPPPELDEARTRYPDTLRTVIGDMRDEQTSIDFTKAALDSFGHIDILVSNAALSVVKPVHLHTEEEWDTVMDVNVKGPFLATRHVVPVMLQQHSGLILITGSISGVAGIPGQGAYAPSKAALHQMTRQMAIDYAAQGIRVNCIAPGTVDTAIVHKSAADSGDPDAFWAMLRNAHPIGRIASAAEIASLYVYLATDHASFFTGAVLMMDGGFTAQ